MAENFYDRINAELSGSEQNINPESAQEKVSDAITTVFLQHDHSIPDPLKQAITVLGNPELREKYNQSLTEERSSAASNGKDDIDFSLPPEAFMTELIRRADEYVNGDARRAAEERRVGVGKLENLADLKSHYYFLRGNTPDGYHSCLFPVTPAAVQLECRRLYQPFILFDNKPLFEVLARKTKEFDDRCEALKLFLEMVRPWRTANNLREYIGYFDGLYEEGGMPAVQKAAESLLEGKPLLPTFREEIVQGTMKMIKMQTRNEASRASQKKDEKTILAERALLECNRTFTGGSRGELVLCALRQESMDKIEKHVHSLGLEQAYEFVAQLSLAANAQMSKSSASLLQEHVKTKFSRSIQARLDCLLQPWQAQSHAR